MNIIQNIKIWLKIVIAWQFFAWLFILSGRSFFQSASAIAGVDIYNESNEILVYINSNFILFEGLLFGFSFGSLFFLIYWISQNTRVRYLSFGRIIIIHSILYIVAFAIVFFVITIILRQFDFFPFDSFNEFLNVLSFKYDIVLVFLIQNILVILGINFIMEVSKKFGPGNIWNLIIGKYHKPVVEERIFMFLDMKDSTGYAEKLGHIKYSQLIQSCFLYLNDLIAKSDGEIYQYVGDEAVLTWNMNKENAVDNSLDLYYNFQDLLYSKADKFKKKYGFVPEFKAGINEGKVTAAEVGNIKREIAYHGDVLNTGARIQGQCNTYGKRLLVSEVFANHISNVSQFKKELIGSLSLKGKSKTINVYSVEKL